MDSLKTAVPPIQNLARGFTLLELAVALVIVGLLIGGLMMPLSAQQDIRLATETRKLLGDVGESLYGYAVSHAAVDGKPYLPCPDTDNDGVENRSGNACVSQEGTLPWADLGLGRQDAWGNPLRYRVATAYSNSATGFALLANGDIKVCAASDCLVPLATGVPAIVVSHGRNGARASADPDEQENLDADTTFVQHAPVGNGFDDLLVWLPTPLLVQRMVNAGRLP